MWFSCLKWNVDSSLFMKLKGSTIFWFLNLRLEIFVFEVHLSIRDLRIGSFQGKRADSNIYLLQQIFISFNKYWSPSTNIYLFQKIFISFNKYLSPSKNIHLLQQSKYLWLKFSFYAVFDTNKALKIIFTFKSELDSIAVSLFSNNINYSERSKLV